MMLDPISKRLLAGAGQNGLISLMYHSITPGKAKSEWQWALSQQQFENQLALLADFGWTTVSPEHLLYGNALPKKSVLITFDDGYADNMLAVSALINRHMIASWFVVAQDVGKRSTWLDEDAPSGLNMLTRAQLLEMQHAGMSIGSHTFSHCRLPLCSPTKIQQELKQSRTLLTEWLDTPVTTFAYPYGLYNADIISATRSAGYQLAFCTRSGFGLVDNDLLQVRRVAIKADDTLSSFARKLAFADNEVSWSNLLSYVGRRMAARIGL